MARQDVRSNVRLIAILALSLALGTLGAYWRVLHCGFVNYDDATYTGHPLVQRGLSAEGIVWAFTGIHASNWHPLTTISHMLDAQMFGTSPVGPHAVNLLLHIASTVLLFLILNRITKSPWKSAFVAALFALHPLHVESVAWVAERKDVLSTFLFMGTVWMYISYAQAPTTRRFALVIGAYALGLLAKPMLVTLPLVLLLLDFWPLGRLTLPNAARKKARGWSGWAVVWEKWPLFAMSVACSIVTCYVQHKGGASVSLERVPMVFRFENAAITYVKYMYNMVWPARLCVFYPYPTTTPAIWKPLSAFVLLAGITFGALRSAKKKPYLAVGWLWYLITLIPVIGLVQVGQQAMADRYTYVPLIGLFVAIAWGVSECVGVWEFGSKGERDKGNKGEVKAPIHRVPHSPILPVAAGVIIAVCCVLTWVQTGYWQDRLTLFSHALAVTDGNYLAYDMVGAALSERGKYQEAVGHFTQAIRIKPDDELVYNNLGNAYTRMGRLEEAVAAYSQSVRLNPSFPITHFNLGMVQVLRGHVDEAIKQLSIVVEQNKGTQGHLEMFSPDQATDPRSIKVAEKELRARPNDPVLRCRLAVALADHGQLEEAIGHLRQVSKGSASPAQIGRRIRPVSVANTADQMDHYKAAKSKSKDAIAHFYLGNVYSNQGKRAEAIKEYEAAIRINPDFARAHNNLAVTLYFTGDFQRAWQEVSICRKAGVQVHPKFIKALSQRMPDPDVAQSTTPVAQTH